MSACGSPFGIEGADQRGRDAEHRHPLLLDEPPEPVVGPVGRALGEDDGRAARTGADDGPRAHDPAHVRREVDDVALVHVGLVRDLARDRDEEAAVDVQHALRLAGRSRRVGEQVRMLRLDVEGGELPRLPPHELRPLGRAPVPLDHLHVESRSGLVDCVAHRHPAAAPKRAVGADDDLGLRRLEPLSHRRRGESRENGHLHGADVRAGVRGDRDLRAHRHVDGDAVAGLNAELDERLRHPNGLVRELAVRARASLAVLAQEDRTDVVRPARRPPVHAVRRDVQAPADEPLRPLDPVGLVEHLLPAPRELEVEVVDHLGPEPFRLLDGEAVQLRVALAPELAPEPHDVRLLEPLARGRPDELAHRGDPSPC